MRIHTYTENVGEKEKFFSFHNEQNGKLSYSYMYIYRKRKIYHEKLYLKCLQIGIYLPICPIYMKKYTGCPSRNAFTLINRKP